MKKFNFFLGTVVFFMVAGCGGFNINSRIDPYLDPAQLEPETGTQTIDLNENGQCPSVTLIVNPENIETRKEKFLLGYDGPWDHYLIPKEFIEMAVQYLEKKLIESNVKIDEQSGKKILVSLEDAKTNIGMWTIATTVKLKIALPEINYSNIYTGAEGSVNQLRATAFALDLSINEFLNDPVFQKYVKCQ